MNERLSFSEMLKISNEKSRADKEMPLPLQLEALRAELARAQTRLNEINAKIAQIEKQIEVVDKSAIISTERIQIQKLCKRFGDV